MLVRILEAEREEVIQRRRWENAASNIPNTLQGQSFLDHHQISSRVVMNQEVVCYPFRNDHEGAIARSSRQLLQELRAKQTSSVAFIEELSSCHPGGRYYFMAVDGDCTFHSAIGALITCERIEETVTAGYLRRQIASFLENLPASCRKILHFDETIRSLRVDGNFQGIHFQLVYLAISIMFSISFTVMSQSFSPPFTYYTSDYTPAASSSALGLPFESRTKQSASSSLRVCFAQSEARQHTDLYVYSGKSPFLLSFNNISKRKTAPFVHL